MNGASVASAMVASALAATTDPIAALGIVSAPSTRGLARRAAIRDTWPGGIRDSGDFAVRFVLRCGPPLSDLLRNQLQQEPSVVCANEVSSSETRLRGPIYALAWWLRYALKNWPAARFVCKADSDTWLALPDLALQLRSIVDHDVKYQGRFAYYGAFGFFSLVDIEEEAAPGASSPSRLYVHRGYAPRFDMGLKLLRQYVIPLCRSTSGGEGRRRRNQSSSPSLQSRCAGPFPFAYGAFIALGSGLASALVAQRGFTSELGQLPLLLRDQRPETAAARAASSSTATAALQPTSELATEDVWLGSAIWRFLGSTVPVKLYMLSGEQRHLYSDDHGLKVRDYLIAFHNRNKNLGRLKLLGLKHQLGHHCSIRPRWVRTDRRCCGRRHVPSADDFTNGAAIGKRSGGGGGDADAAAVAAEGGRSGGAREEEVGQAAAATGTSWPAFQLDQTYRADEGCACDAASRIVDLANTTTLRQLGVSQLLGPSSYMRPEPQLRKRILARRRSKGCGRGGRNKEHQGSCPAEREERSVDEEYWAHLYLWQKEE